MYQEILTIRQSEHYDSQMQDLLSRAHHYVPEWYQKRFLSPGAAKLHVLDLNPETVKLPNGKSFTHNAYRMKPTSKCFYSDDLYMLRFGQSITDTVERTFFGAVDRRGSAAVEEFNKVTGFSKGFAQAQGDIPPYLGAQRFRTPRGLDWLKGQTGASDHNQTLAIMAKSFQLHTTMWAEGIWEIVRARNTQTKFIISDEPAAAINRVAFDLRIRFMRMTSSSSNSRSNCTFPAYIITWS